MAKKRRKSSSRSPSARRASTRSPSARTPSTRSPSAHTPSAQVGEPSSSADQQPSGEQQEQQPTFPEFEMPELEPEPATEQLSKPESMGLLRLGLIMIGVLGTGIILFVLAILVFIAPLGTVYTTLAPSVCATFSCIEHAYYLNKSMLRSVSPCDNFYQFVCGSWTASRRRYTSVGQALYDSVSDAIQAQANNHPPTTRATATRKAYEMYLSCTQTHEVARTHESENSLRQFMAEHRLVISSYISGIDTVDLLVDLAVNWNLPFLFELAPHVYNASQVDVWERLAFELTYEAFVAQKLNAQAGLRLQGLEEFSDDAVFYMSYCYISCARTASKGTPVRRPHVCNAIRTTAHFRETFKCPPLKSDEGRASSNCSPFWNLTYST